MAGTRIQLDLFIPDMTPQELKENYPLAVSEIKRLVGKARKLNEGADNEEDTVRAQYHICRHDEGLPCDEWTDI